MKRKEEIKLSPEFKKRVNDDECEKIIYMAKALDELPPQMAKDMICYMQCTNSFAGSQMDNIELDNCLWELCRIRAQKEDGFVNVIDQHQILLRSVWEYKEVYDRIGQGNMEMFIIYTVLSNDSLKKERKVLVQSWMKAIIDGKGTTDYFDNALDELCFECPEMANFVSGLTNLGRGYEKKENELIIACARLYFRIQKMRK